MSRFIHLISKPHAVSPRIGDEQVVDRGRGTGGLKTSYKMSVTILCIFTDGLVLHQLWRLQAVGKDQGW
jgi:hypothetical protein